MRPWFVVVGTGAVLLSGALQLQRGHVLFALAMLLLATAMVLPLFEPQKAEVKLHAASTTLTGWRRVAYWGLALSSGGLLLVHLATRP